MFSEKLPLKVLDIDNRLSGWLVELSRSKVSPAIDSPLDNLLRSKVSPPGRLLQSNVL